MADRLTPQPWKCFEEKLSLHHTAEYSKIPQYHIVCTSTLATRDPLSWRRPVWGADCGTSTPVTIS